MVDFARINKENARGLKHEPPSTVKPTYAVGVSILLTNAAGQVLLAKRKNCDGAGLLSTPGGRLEREEDLYECAAREFREECLAELVPEDIEIVAWREHFRFGHHYFMFYAHVTRFVGEIRNGISDKSEDWGWFDIEKLTEQTCTEPRAILSGLLVPEGCVYDGRGFTRNLTTAGPSKTTSRFVELMQRLRAAQCPSAGEAALYIEME
jgi:ADP-ribose pyrophosphatase YjhB (NUDIX family)